MKFVQMHILDVFHSLACRAVLTARNGRPVWEGPEFPRERRDDAKEMARTAARERGWTIRN
jgi:transcriptional regulator of met regulon